MNLLLALAIYTAVSFVAAQSLPGVKMQKGLGPAVALALVFGFLNVLIGWFITLLLGVFATVFTILTLGLGFPVFFLVGVSANAILLRVADALLPGFELDGWTPALIMGFFFAMAGWILRVVGAS